MPENPPCLDKFTPCGKDLTVKYLGVLKAEFEMV
jgi:hypothetical protein